MGLLTACTHPEPQDPVAPAPFAGSFSRSGDRTMPDRWWQDFDDAALATLVDTALDENLSFRATWDRLRQAEATARRAGAPLYPTVNANTSVTASDSGGSQSRPGGAQTQLTLGGAANYEIDLWGGLRSSARAAVLDAQASRAQVETAAITLSAQVARSWYALVEARARTALLKEQLQTNREVLQLIRLRFRQGQASAPDVLRQEQLVESTQGDLVRTEGDRRLQRHTLAVLLGRTPQSLDLPDRSALVTPPPLPETGMPADLIRRRPDLRQAFLRVRAADERVSAAIAERYPSLTLNASLETTASSTVDLFSGWFANLVSQVAMPLIDGGRRAAETERTRAVLSEALNNYENNVLEAVREVEDALTRERQQQGVLESLQSQLKLADQVVVQLRRRFTQGATDYLDVLNALTSQQSLERQVLTAKLNVINARVDLARALAGGWRMERPDSRVAVREE